MKKTNQRLVAFVCLEFVIGAVHKLRHHLRGRGGVWIPPKSDDVIYDQPLKQDLNGLDRSAS